MLKGIPNDLRDANWHEKHMLRRARRRRVRAAHLLNPHNLMHRMRSQIERAAAAKTYKDIMGKPRTYPWYVTLRVRLYHWFRDAVQKVRMLLGGVSAERA